MTVEEFIERIRVGVVAGIFTVKDACDALTAGGWHTTRDVPAEHREHFLESLSAPDTI